MYSDIYTFKNRCFTFSTAVRQRPFSYLTYFLKQYINALAERNKFKFCIVVEKKIMLLPARIFFFM